MAQAPLLTLIFHGSIGAYREDDQEPSSGSTPAHVDRHRWGSMTQYIDATFRSWPRQANMAQPMLDDVGIIT